MPTDTKLADLVARMPSPNEKKDKGERQGILSNVDRSEVEKVLAELKAGGRDSAVGLVGLLADTDPPADSKARHAIHALALQSGGWPEDERRAFATALASTLDPAKPKEPQAFVLRQIQLCGDRAVVPAVAKLLTDEELVGPATAALVAIRDGAADAVRAALPAAPAKAKVHLIQALGVLRDVGPAADAVRKAAADADPQTRQVALWALAVVGDAPSVDLALMAANAEGYERIQGVKACLLLAEALAAAGKGAEARKVYTQLRDSRNDAADAYVREIADRALATVG